MARERVVKITEARRIIEMRRQGMNATEIAKKIGRHRITVLDVLHGKTPRIQRRNSDALKYFTCLVPCRVSVAEITEQALFNLRYVEGKGDWRKHVRLRPTFGEAFAEEGITWEYQNIRKKRIPFSRFFIFPTGIYTAYGENTHLNHGQKVNVARMIYRILNRIGAIIGAINHGRNEVLPEVQVRPVDSGSDGG